MPGRKKKLLVDSDEDSDPAVKRGSKKPAKKPAEKPKKSALKKGKGKENNKEKEEDEEEEEGIFEWWKYPEEEVFHVGVIKWKTLEHKGPIFAPPYKPHGLPVVYDGQEIRLTPEEEEVAMMYAIKRESHYYGKQVFKSNFFEDWKKILHQRPEGRKITSLTLCNFDQMWQHYVEERAVQKALPADVKKKIKAEAAEAAQPYMWVLWDGRKEKVANPRVEPPGLFQGRGLHPKMGCLKRRVQPEDVTINVQDLKNPPPAPEGHKWGSVVSDNTVTWLAKWQDTNSGGVKYILPDRSSAESQRKDRAKFNKARSLKDRIDDIRAAYTKNFQSPDPREVQMAVAMYFIDILALRVGGEKSEEEADTVGCCSLRKEHVTPMTREEDGKTKYYLHFDFLGKDSIRYVNDMDISEEVFRLVKKMLIGKDNRPIPRNQLFNLITPTDLNTRFKEISKMDGLSAKVFRTYNASFLLDKIFSEEPVDSSLTEAEKMVYFNCANTKVAILCNHQKAKSKGHDDQTDAMHLRIKELKDRLQRLEEARQSLKEAKKANFEKVWAREKKQFNEFEEQLQEEWLEKHGTEEDKQKWEERGKVSKKKVADDSDDEPVTKKRKPSAPKKRTRKGDSSDEDEEDEKPAKKKKPARKPAKKRQVPDSEEEDSDDDSEEEEEEAPKKRTKKAGRKPSSKKAASKRSRKKKDDSEDDDDDD